MNLEKTIELAEKLANNRELLEAIKLLNNNENANHIGQGMIGKNVLIRTYSAGVHLGTLKAVDNYQNCILANAKRLHCWYGACSLSQVAVDGVDTSKSRISVTVGEVLLERVIEIIPITEKAHANIFGAEEWKK